GGIARRLRDNLLQQPEPLRPKLRTQEGYARDIAARPAQAHDEPDRDRVLAGRKDDWDGRGRGFGGLCRNGPAARNDDSNSAANQVGRQFRQPIVVVVRRAKFDGDVAAFDVAGFAQALAECRPRQLGRLGRCSVEISDHRYRRLLRARCERPRCRAAEQRDELAALHCCGHSITSSAKTSNFGGISRPSAFAVFWLITNSNLVGWITGKSPGLAPLRIEPV